MSLAIRYNMALLPRRNYKIIKDCHCLSTFYLCRYPSGKRWHVFPSEIKDNWDTSELSRGMSCNLLSVYKHKDACIRPGGKVKDGHHQLWKEGDAGIIPPNLKYRKRANFIGIKYDDILRREIRIDNFEISFRNGSIRTDALVLRLIHRPTYCNFWHFEIRIYGLNEGSEYLFEEISNVSKKGIKRYLEHAAEILGQKLMGYIIHSKKCRPKYLRKSIYTK